MTWYYIIPILLLWPFTYLLNKTRLLFNICNTFSRSTRNKVSVVTPGKPADDQKRLTSLLRGCKEETTVFVSVDVHIWDLDHSRITDIGISIWHPGATDYSDILSFHWRIRDNLLLKNQSVPNEPDIFTSNISRVISEGQIKACLDNIFDPLVGQFKRVIIVGHDVCYVTRLLDGYWNPPGAATFLDTQKIWQLQHRLSDNITLEEALDTTEGVRYSKSLLNNAGNDARITLYLLQAQGRLASQSKNQQDHAVSEDLTVLHED